MLSNKALAISGSITGSAVAGIGIAYLTDSSKTIEPAREDNTQVSKGQKISDLLVADSRLLLNNGDSEWTQNWNTFKGKYASDREPVAPWKLGNWSNVFGAEGVADEFKEKCKTNSQQEVDSKTNKLYLEVKEYCTKAKPKQAGDV